MGQMRDHAGVVAVVVAEVLQQRLEPAQQNALDQPVQQPDGQQRQPGIVRHQGGDLARRATYDEETRDR